MDKMAVKQKAMSLSAQKYLLIDRSKIAIKGFCSFIDSDDFDAIICDQSKELDVETLPDNYILV